MDNNSFYRGLLFELNKTAQSASPGGGTAGMPKPTPPAGGAPKAVTPNTAKVPPVQLNPATPATSTPAITAGTSQKAKPIAPWEQGYANAEIGQFVADMAGAGSRILPDSVVKNLVHNSAKDVQPGNVPELGKWQRGLLNQNPAAQEQFKDEVVNRGIDQINNSGLGDVLLGEKATPQVQAYKDWIMSDPTAASKLQAAMSNKTDGLGSLDEHGQATMAFDKIDWKKFINNNWGKLLIAALGIGGIAMLGGGHQQNPVNVTVNNAGQGGLGIAPTTNSKPSFF